MIGGVLGYKTYKQPDVYFANSGSQEITLADGSKITLYKGSKLTVKSFFIAPTRDVFLEGNAMFNISKSKDHPFIVHGLDYETKVLGTVFQVDQSNGAFNVKLFEGKVAVNEKSNKKNVYILNPRQEFTNYGNKKVAAVVAFERSFEEDLVSERGKYIDLHFKGCLLKEAVKAIEKAYRIKVNYPEEYADQQVSINLNNMPVDDVLQTLALSFDLKIKDYENYYQLEK